MKLFIHEYSRPGIELTELDGTLEFSGTSAPYPYLGGIVIFLNSPGQAPINPYFEINSVSLAAKYISGLMT